MVPLRIASKYQAKYCACQTPQNAQRYGPTKARGKWARRSSPAAFISTIVKPALRLWFTAQKRQKQYGITLENHVGTTVEGKEAKNKVTVWWSPKKAEEREIAKEKRHDTLWGSHLWASEECSRTPWRCRGSQRWLLGWSWRLHWRAKRDRSKKSGQESRLTDKKVDGKMVWRASEISDRNNKGNARSDHVTGGYRKFSQKQGYWCANLTLKKVIRIPLPHRWY